MSNNLLGAAWNSGNSNIITEDDLGYDLTLGNTNNSQFSQPVNDVGGDNAWNASFQSNNNQTGIPTNSTEIYESNFIGNTDGSGKSDWELSLEDDGTTNDKSNEWASSLEATDDNPNPYEDAEEIYANSMKIETNSLNSNKKNDDSNVNQWGVDMSIYDPVVAEDSDNDDNSVSENNNLNVNKYGVDMSIYDPVLDTGDGGDDDDSGEDDGDEEIEKEWEDMDSRERMMHVLGQVGSGAQGAKDEELMRNMGGGVHHYPRAAQSSGGSGYNFVDISQPFEMPSMFSQGLTGLYNSEYQKMLEGLK